MLAKKIWDTLSQIDVNNHVETKNKFKYLPWAWAHATLMRHFPDTSHYFEEEVYDDGTVMVTCHMIIREGEESVGRHMHLPVLDFRNKPIANPDAMARNNTRQRCYVKVMAMFGLGTNLYTDTDSINVGFSINEEQGAVIRNLIIESGAKVADFCKAFNVRAIDDLPADKFALAKRTLNRKIEKAEESENENTKS
jgi:hypothetical protein